MNKMSLEENKKPTEQNEKKPPKEILLRVFRDNRQKEDNSGHRYDTFKVATQRWTTVLDALLHAKSYQDSSIGIRYSCRMASCGSCGMKINGIPRLACYTKVSELEGSTITVEPLANFPVIRDLVTDFTQFFTHHHDVKPFTQSEHADIRDRNKLSEFVQSPDDL